MMDWDILDEEIRRELDAISLGPEDSDTESSPTPFQTYPAAQAEEVSDVTALFRGYLETTGGAEGVEEVLSGVKELLHTSSPIHTAAVTPLHPVVDQSEADDSLRSLDDNDHLAQSANTPADALVSGNVDADASGCDHSNKPADALVSGNVDADASGCDHSNTPADALVSGNVDADASGCAHSNTPADALVSGNVDADASGCDHSNTPADALVSGNVDADASGCAHSMDSSWEREKLVTEQQLAQEQLLKEIELNALIEENQRKLEKRERMMLERERAKAAVKLQAHLRGHLTRLRYRETRLLKNKMATLIQASWRGHQAKKKKLKLLKGIGVILRSWRAYRFRQRRLCAVVCVQKHWRAYRFRQKRFIAAVCVQKHWRAYKFRQKRFSSVVCIQKHWRAVKERRQSVKRMKAARVIQRAWKGYRTATSVKVTEENTPDITAAAHLDQTTISTEPATSDLPQLTDNSSVRQSQETLSNPLPSNLPIKHIVPLTSPNKLTISKRIQSSLRLMKQSSSAQELEVAVGASSPLQIARSSSLPGTTKKKLTKSDWSQLAVDKNILVSVLAGQEGLPINADIKQNQDSKEQVSLIENKSVPPLKDEPSEDSTPSQDKIEYVQSLQESPSRESAVENESVALAKQREGRQREMALAQQSRDRMSQLISEEEIQQVAKKKRAHATYRNQLEFAAQPLSPRAWCGLVTERLEEWRRQHRTWAHPTPPTPATRSSHPHPPHTGTPLTKAQIVAASPKGTPLEQVAIVVMYRSRSPVELRSLTKCTQLSNLSLTKCGLASLSGLEGCSQLKEIKVQSNSIEHMDLYGLKGLCFADVSDNRLASIHGLQSCANLLTLDLSENRLARLAGLDGCHQLQKLTVDSNLIINSKGMVSLQMLQWFSCSENHLPRVEGLDNSYLLQHLGLGQNNLQQAPMLCNHVLLRELCLDGNSLSDMAPLSRAWLPLLQTLSLANNCITELASLTCMIMLETLDVGNNSLYDLPVLLQCVRGCYQLRKLVVNGNPVSEEPKLRHYITKALPCLATLDNNPLRTKAQVPTVVSTNSAYVLCKRQIEEQNEAKPKQTNQVESGDGPPTPASVVQALQDRVASCSRYEALLICHLREHEATLMHNSAPSSPSPRRKQLLRTRAAVRIQATWRGFVCRKRVDSLKQIYHRAATIIQAHYRGFRLRARLRIVLEAAQYIDESDGAGDGAGSDDDIDFEEEIVVDFLDESALDRELEPLSPTEPPPSRRKISSLTQPYYGGRPVFEASTPAPPPPMVPVYTLPGCVEAEVPFDEIRRQQRESRREPVRESSVSESFGAPIISEESDDSVRGNPLAAWGSTSGVDSSTVEESEKKVESVKQIVNEWGLQSSSTAKLMLKRAKRHKKMQAKSAQKKKLADPAERLAAFKRKAPPTHIVRAQAEMRGYSPAARTVSSQSDKKDFVYRWVNNHTIVHEQDPLYKPKNVQRGSSSLLPPMEPRVLAGHAPQLVQTLSVREQAAQFSSGPGSSNSYPSIRHKLLNAKKINSATNLT